MALLLFKIVQLIIIAAFAVLISYVRKREGVVALFNPKLVLTIRFLYPIPLFIYVYVVFAMNQIFILDFLAPLLTLLGTIILFKARLDLREYHTWLGYRLEKPKIVTQGIYAFVRHPIYLGIFIFSFGGFPILLLHAPSPLMVIAILILGILLPLLSITAFLETKRLEEECPEEFLKYKRQVHPFLPIRKFKG